MTTPTFRESYEKLQRHAETLRNQREPDLDNLLNIVTESVAAYKVCKSRIDAVEQALEQALSGAGVEAAGSDGRDDGASYGAEGGDVPEGARVRTSAPRADGASPQVKRTQTSFTDDDGDIPF